jgi:hypothetical protein
MGQPNVSIVSVADFEWRRSLEEVHSWRSIRMPDLLVVHRLKHDPPHADNAFGLIAF